MPDDDGFDLGDQMLEVRRREVLTSQPNGRLEVVKGPSGPDAKIMEGGGDKHLVGAAAVRRRKELEVVEYTGDVVMVCNTIVTQDIRELLDHLVDDRKSAANDQWLKAA